MIERFDKYDDVYLSFFSESCLKNSMEINKCNLNDYLEILNIILNYENTFSKINKQYKDKLITEDIDNAFKKCLKSADSRITLCMIVKNEELFIVKNLESHLPFFDEIIIVDTGSTDSTRDIINKYIANSNKLKLFTMLWENDFAKARNYAKSLASNNWILFLDADEVMYEKEIMKLKKIACLFSMFKYKNNLAFSLKGYNIEQNIEVTTMQRFFYNSESIWYYGKIHEYIISDVDKDNFITNQLDITFIHYGYMKNIIESKNKNLRNVQILKEMLRIEPNNFRWLYYYTREGMGMIPDEELIKCIKEKIDISYILHNQINLLDDYKIDILFNLFLLYLKNNNYNECLKMIPFFEEHYGENYDIAYYKIYLNFLIYKKNIKSLLNETLKYRRNHFEKNNSYINNEGYHIDLMIAILLFEIGDFKKSKKYFEFLKDKIDIYRMYPNIEKIILLLNNY